MIGLKSWYQTIIGRTATRAASSAALRPLRRDPAYHSNAVTRDRRQVTESEGPVESDSVRRRSDPESATVP